MQSRRVEGFRGQKEAQGSWVGVFPRRKNGGQEFRRRAAGWNLDAEQRQ